MEITRTPVKKANGAITGAKPKEPPEAQPHRAALIHLLAVVVLLLALLGNGILVRYTRTPLTPAEANLWQTAIIVIGGIFGVSIFKGAKLAFGSKKSQGRRSE
jgi:hypothetical protein